MRNHRVIDAIAGLAVAGSAVLYFLGTTPLAPKPDVRFHEAVGTALAKEVLSQVRPGVGVAVLRRETSEFAQPEADLQYRAFEKAFLAGGGRIATVQSLQLDPLRNLEVPPGDFFELLRRSPEGSGIVSFMGPPVLGPEQLARLGEVRPAVVAFCPGSIPLRVDLPALFEAGLLRAALVDRDVVEPAGGAGKPGSAGAGAIERGVVRRGFEAVYRMVRKADAGGLPRPGSGVDR